MISLYDILEAGDGQLFGDVSAAIFTDFCFDSRRVKAGELFVAVKTERGDGHQYMQEAVRSGALGILCHRPPEFDTSGLTVIVVRDVEAALLNWARTVLTKFGTTVIGVTGTSGKSMTKEAIARILGTRYRVYKSPGSYNGRFGLPLALGKLAPEDKLAVLEFGADHFGEMAELVNVTRPSVGVVTNIGYSYMDRLGDLDSVAAEHAALVASLPKDGLAVLNYDDDRVRRMSVGINAPSVTVALDRVGTAFGADLIAYNLVVARDKVGFDLRRERERYIAQWVPLLGAHHLYGALMALAIGTAYGISIEDGLRALKDIQPLPGRMHPLEGKGKSLLIDDSFSANPNSTLAALDWMRSLRTPDRQGRLIFVLGDMDDLGAQTVSAHREIGRHAAEVADFFVTEGDLAAIAGRAALDHGMARRNVRITFSPEDAAAAVGDDLTETDVVLIKGSPSARMELVTRALLADDGDLRYLPRKESAYDSVWINRPSRPTWLEVDKTAIAHNTRRLCEIIGPDVALMAVIKANAYGHGAVAVATTALLNGATYLGVASVSEAAELRDAAIDAPVLVLGYTPPWAVRQAIRYGLTLTLYDLELARAYDRVAREMNATLNVHIKVDTGMTRLGLLPDDVTPFFRSVRNLRNLNLEGIFTHFSSAETNRNYTLTQLTTFEDVLNPLLAAGFQFPHVHAANTAATLYTPQSRLNMVRIGIGLYGLHPDPETARLPDDFRPALSWKTSVAQVKTVPPKTYVGYGNTYRTKGTERIAVIPVGYADGFRRAPQHWGNVLVGGQRAPIVGRISMDMTMINVTNITGVNIGDEVVLIGRQGKEKINVEDVARQLSTSSYEVISTILARVPRV